MNLLAYVALTGPAKARTGTVSIWDLSRDGQSLLAEWKDIPVDCICVSSVGMRVGIASYSTSTVVVFELPSQRRIREIGFEKERINMVSNCCCDTACNKIAVVAGGKVKVHDVNTGQRLFDLPKCGNQSVNDLVFSADGQYVFATYSHRLMQFDASTGAVIKMIEDSIRTVCARSLRMNPCGSRVLCLRFLDEAQDIYEAMVLNTTTGVVTNQGEWRSTQVFGFLDNESIIVSGPDYLNTETNERTSTVVRKDRVLDAAVVNGVPVVFDLDGDFICATNLSSWEELFRIRLELRSQDTNYNRMIVSTHDSVVLM
jgi:hypothetical protein